MKILVAFYSRTNTTRLVAEELAKRLGADLDEIIDTKDRSGAVGYLKAAHDAMKKSDTVIEESKYNPGDYDLVIIGTPIWAWTFSVPVATYMNKYKDNIGKIAFFITQGAEPPKQAEIFLLMEKKINQRSLANLHLSTKQVRGGEYTKELNDFVETLGLKNIDERN